MKINIALVYSALALLPACTTTPNHASNARRQERAVMPRSPGTRTTRGRPGRPVRQAGLPVDASAAASAAASY